MSADMTQMSYFAVKEGFQTYQQKIMKNFTGYLIRKDSTFENAENTRTVKFSSYIDLLKSKYCPESLDNQWIFDG